MGKQLFYLGQLTRLLWLRATIYSLVAVIAVVAAHALGPLVPSGLAGSIEEDAARGILDIIASSMLVVATFSLATLVAAASSVTVNTSPRAAGLLLQDRSAQKALSSFVGAFIFSVVGLIAIGADVYDAGGRFVLFAITLAVLAIVVVRLLRWIDQLSHIGRVDYVIDRIERETEKALAARRPFLGAAPGENVPVDAKPLQPRKVGYIQNIDVARLDALARRHDLRVYLALLPGALVRLSRPVLHVQSRGPVGPRLEEALLAAVVISGSRTFEQDPRFGLVVLSEIASRALSPAVNDPGTAIDVVGTATRVLSLWAETHWEKEPEGKFRHVSAPPLSAEDFFNDVFRPIARSGAGMVEVGAALQKAFADLALAKAEGFSEAARHHSRAALARAEHALTFEGDIVELRRLAEKVATQTRECSSP